jgi:hypothetical protein
LGERIRGEEVKLERFWKWVFLGVWEWSFAESVRGFVGLYKRLLGGESRDEIEAIFFWVFVCENEQGSEGVLGLKGKWEREWGLGNKSGFISHYLVETWRVLVCGVKVPTHPRVIYFG